MLDVRIENYFDNKSFTQVYILMGNFLSNYNLVRWRVKEKGGSDNNNYTCIYPLGIFAVLDYLKRKGNLKEYKITFLVPHSLFIRFVNDDITLNDITNYEKLKEYFLRDIDNFYFKFCEKIKNKLKIAKERNKKISFQDKVQIQMLNALLKEKEKFNKKFDFELNEDNFLDYFENDNSKKEEINIYLKKLNSDLKNLLKNIEIKIVPSISSYRKEQKNSKVEFKYNLTFFDRVLFNYFSFLKDFNENVKYCKSKDLKKINTILDLSVGLNALISEVEEAYNSLCTYASLYNSFYNDNRYIFLVSVSDPVFSYDGEEKNVNVYQIERKMLFNEPLKYKDIQILDVYLSEIKKVPNTPSITDDENTLKLENFKILPELSLFLFYLLKYNLPLAITLLSQDEHEIISSFLELKNNVLNILSDIFANLKNYMEVLDEVQTNEFKFNFRLSYENIFKSFPIKNKLRSILGENRPENITDSQHQEFFNKLRNLTYLLGFGEIISEEIRIFCENNCKKDDPIFVTLENNGKIKAVLFKAGEGIENHEYFKFIRGLYDKFNLKINKLYLERDLNPRRKSKKYSEEFANLIYYWDHYRKNYFLKEKIRDSKDIRIDENNIRNFLSHSGFTLTLICIEEENIEEKKENKKNYLAVYYSQKPILFYPKKYKIHNKFKNLKELILRLDESIKHI